MSVSRSSIFSAIALLGIFVGIPLATLSYQASRTGQSLTQFLARAVGRMSETDAHVTTAIGRAHRPKGEKIDFLDMRHIGSLAEEPPWICQTRIVDLDHDGLKDILVCDGRKNAVYWVRQYPKGTYTEKQIGGTIRGPARAEPCDIDGDGDLDLLVAAMGMVMPNNDKIGSVIILENNGKQEFKRHVLVDRIMRPCDIQPGDLDGDGDLDLAIAQFGYDDGEICWMENKGNWRFDSHVLLRLSGTIHTPVVDFDGDGDLDIAALVSQEWEEIYLFENDGAGRFKTRLIYGSTNEDYGSSGIWPVDLDRDGDPDILYANGDAFIRPGTRPWHGLQWLENKGNLTFEYRRIADFQGVYNAYTCDLDGDGDLDILAVSTFNDWKKSDVQSMMWFENDGKLEFIPHDVAVSPTHLLSLDGADMDDDGDLDFVTGGFHAYPPYDPNRLGRVCLWVNNGKLLKRQEQTLSPPVQSDEAKTAGRPE